MDAVFYFEFVDFDHQSGLELYAFNMCLPLGTDTQDLMDNLYEEVTCDLESDYGVHDWSSSPSDDVFGIGYGSYEVEQSKRLELMNRWRDHFVSLCGGDDVTAVVQLDPTILEQADDAGVFAAVRQALKP